MIPSCKKDFQKNTTKDLDPKITLNTIVAASKKINEKTGKQNLNWGRFVLLVSLTDSIPYQILVPINGDSIELSTYKTFTVNQKGNVVGTSLFNRESFNDAISLETKTQIADAFIQFQKQGYHINNNIVLWKQKEIERTRLPENFVKNSPLASLKSESSAQKTQSNAKFSDQKKLMVDNSNSTCGNSFSVQYYITITNPCYDWELENYRESLREYAYNRFQMYFSSNQYNLSINLMGGKTVISGPSSDVSQFPDVILRQMFAQYFSEFIPHEYSNCLPSLPKDVTIQNFSSSCGNSSGGGGSGGAPFSVILDPSIFSNPELKCLFNKLLDPSNRANQKLLKGFMDNTNYNVTFKVAETIPTTTGDANGSTVVIPGSNNATIYLRSGFVSGNPIWIVGKTVVHEMAHAYLAQKLMSIGGASNLQQNLNDVEFKDLFEYYTKFVNPSTGTLSTTANSNFEHAAMAGLLIDDMARGLQDFVEMNTPDIKNNPYVSFQNYKALAWLGLTETTAYDSFKSTTGATDADQNMQISLLAQGTVNNCN